jgi:branched-subunit amino acid transport protein
MKKSLSKRISIFLTVDEKSISGYFNQHDPAPIYERQLGHELQVYIQNSVTGIKRFSTVRYKFICKELSDKKYAEPLLRAIQRHYTIKKRIKEIEFYKFKRRNFKILFVSMAIVVFSQGMLPIIVGQNHRLHSAFSNALDVFSWVILWKPIERLIFHWNDYKKHISILGRLAHAEAIIIDNAKKHLLDSDRAA